MRLVKLMLGGFCPEISRDNLGIEVGIISCSNPLESKTISYCTIRSCTIRIVQYKIVFDSKGLEQDMVITNLNKNKSESDDFFEKIQDL